MTSGKKRVKKESKKLSEKKDWICPSCKNDKPHPCDHLDKLVREPSSQSVSAMPVRDIDSVVTEEMLVMWAIPPEISSGAWERNFRQKLIKYGMSEVKIDIVVHKYVYEMTLKDISDELGIRSPSTVFRLLKEALEDLKKRGFK
jgi:hypothetical protein